MDWRTWVYDRLTNDSEVTSIVPAFSWHAASALESAPESKPFGVIKFGPVVSRIVTVQQTNVAIWVHDHPGSFLLIDSAMIAVGHALRDPIEDGSIGVDVGEISEDFSDDILGTITKRREVRLFAREEAP